MVLAWVRDEPLLYLLCIDDCDDLEDHELFQNNRIICLSRLQLLQVLL